MIRQIRLHDFASHDEAELDFGNGKNVIIGATGSGKTNILQAIDFAFLGDVPEVNLTELIADNSDTAEVIVEYDDPRTGQSYLIQRTLKRNTEGKADHECLLTNLGTGEVVKKPEPVRKTLESFGVDASVWRYIIHVAQGKFGDLLEETLERKISLDKLFQVSQLEAAHQELGRKEGPIAKLELRKQTNSDKLTALRQSASKLEDEKSNLKRIEEQGKQKQDDLKELEKNYKKLEVISQKTTDTLTKLKTVDDESRKAEITSSNALKQINVLVAHLNNENLLPTSVTSQLPQQSSSQLASEINELSQGLQTISKQDRKLEELQRESTEKMTMFQAKIDQAVKDRDLVLKELEDVGNFLDGKGEQPEIACERCGSLLTKAQWTDHLDERRKLAEKLEKESVAYSKERDAEQLRAEILQKQHEDTSIMVKNLEHALPILSQIQDYRRAIEESSNPERMKSRANLLKELRMLLDVDPSIGDQEVLDRAVMIAIEMKNLPEQIEKTRKEAESFEETFLRLQRKRVEDAEQAKDEADKLEPIITLDGTKIAALETVRTSLREIQPVVRRSFVTKITQSANDYMKRLYSGADLENFELTEDYQFLVTRAGYKRHARRLSGGQQVLASMAFLLALSEVLSQLDFLILDEPTTHLDEDRRKELVNVLESLKRVPQLIIVDHHPELLDAADTRFQVTLSNEGQSQVVQVSE